MLICSVVLGKVSYYGETYTAIREIYHNGIWKLVFVKNNDRILMLVY
ncbi:hypothetical protein SAMN04487909_11978 [Aneurinibacillus migulanus]|uniref:Uncharacterized protein n=1 Tax=Aneurinibacillus migulanus TaxID=47500 RepID=A0A1G8UBI9_ANEMI|nr:hypothetical protein SAMN04487909_11978 [Aneurinibacillus migulanus]